MFYHPKLKASVDRSECRVCQENKLTGAGYGELPLQKAILMPWEEVHVDLIGPWKVTVNNREFEFMALTCIDPITNLPELIRIEDKTS